MRNQSPAWRGPAVAQRVAGSPSTASAAAFGFREAVTWISLAGTRVAR